MNNDAALELALAYAKQGAAVLPIRSDKSPACQNGFKDATNDPSRLAGLFRGAAVAGVGIVPGSINCVVFDVDDKCAPNCDKPYTHGRHGTEELLAYQAAHDWPVTAQARTGSGGLHYWFQLPAGLQLGNTSPFASIDVRAHSGYVVAPGTTMGDRTWAWVNEPTANELPQDLLALLTSATTTDRADATQEDIEECGPEMYELLVSLGGWGPKVRVGNNGRKSIQLSRPRAGGQGWHESASIGYAGHNVVHIFTSSWNLADGRQLPSNSTMDLDELQNYLKPPPGMPTLSTDAFIGPLAEAVTLFEDNEADPSAILLALLTAFANLVGPNPYVQLAPQIKERARLFALVVGESAKARKSSAVTLAQSVIEAIDKQYEEARIMGGFGSGHILVDQLAALQPHVEGDVRRGDAVLVHDKRLLIAEQEFVRVLRTLGQEGNNLSAIIRSAFDGSKLEVRSRGKTSVVPKGEHHIGTIGCITAEELKGTLTNTEAYNGFGNRFLYAWTRKSRAIALSDKELDEEKFNRVVTTLRSRQVAAKGVERVHLDDAAKKLWTKVYQELRDDDPQGLLGTIIARSDMHTIRLALVYALADGSTVIREEHIRAAYAVWKFCRDSAALIFGERSASDPAKDRAVNRLRDKVYELLYLAEDKGLKHGVLKGRATSHSNATYFDEVIDRLLKEGRIVAREEKVAKTGPLPTVYYADQFAPSKEG